MRRWTLYGIVINFCWVVSCQSVGDFVPLVNETSDPCSSVLQPPRGNRVIKTAYAMATLSAIVYYLPFKQGKAIHAFLMQRTGKVRSRFCRLRHFVANILRTIFRRKVVVSPSCHIPKVHAEHHPYVLRYWLHGWFERTVIPGVNFHETDLLISTKSRNTLVISFAGTSSRTDHATNLQTFEPVNHSGIFRKHEGSLHRGFFNAYSRVDRGQVHSLSHANGTHQLHLPVLDAMFQQCTFDRSNRTRQEISGSNHHNTARTSKRKRPTLVRRKRGGCFVAGYKLMHLLQELVITTLRKGGTVHISGHSLGGGLATFFAMDLAANFPRIPLRRLYLWTFGAPHIADGRFWQSMMRNRRCTWFLHKRYRRFVTLYDQCRRVDFVSTVTAHALAGDSTFARARLQRRLAGITDAATVEHPVAPDYIRIPWNVTTLHAHSMAHYLTGLSRMSRQHPLSTDIPHELLDAGQDIAP